MGAKVSGSNFAMRGFAKRGHVKTRDAVCLLATLLVLAAGPSCGGGGSASGPKGLTVEIMQPAHSPTIDQGQAVSIQAQVLNDSSKAGVTWTLGPPSHKGDPVGTLSNASNSGVTYTAPDVVTQATSVTVTATSITDPTNSAVLGILLEPAPAITTISSDLSPAVVGTSYQQILNMAGGVGPYTWTVIQGVLPDGLLLTSQDVNPGNLPGNPVVTGLTFVNLTGKPKTSTIANFTLQVTDATGFATTAVLTLPVDPKPLKIQVPTIFHGQMGMPYPPTAFVTTDGTGPYQWSFSNLPPGFSFSDDGVLSGSPTEVNNFTIGIQVTDSQTPIAGIGTAVFTLTVDPADSSCASGNESALTSTAPYAFLLRGFDKDGPVFIAGSFTTDGAGKITGGTEDINRAGGVHTNLNIVAAGSSYSLGTNRGCLTLANSAGDSNVFRVTMGGPSATILSSGRMIEFDDDTGTGTRASGTIRLQDPSSFNSGGLSGLYAFGFSGRDASNGRFAMAGSTSASSGALSNLAADINDAGTLYSMLTGGSGSYSVSPSGRGTGSFTAGGFIFNLAFYMLDKSNLFFITMSPRDATHPVGSGEAVLTAGTFSTAALTDNHIFHTTGLSPDGPDVSVGVLSFDGNAKFAGTLFEDHAGTPVLDPVTGANVHLLSGSYSVDTGTGRLSFSGPDAGTAPPIIYAVPGTTGVTGFLVGTDTAASSGRMEFQVTNPPQFNALSGNFFFGTEEDADALTPNFEGLTSPDTRGNFSGTQDASVPGNQGLGPNQFFSGKYTIKVDGTGTFGGNTVSVSNGSTIYYIDESPLNVHTAIVVAERAP